MTLSEFISKYTGVPNVGNTDENKGECVGLVMVWVKNLGLSHFWGHAKDLFANAPSAEWDKIRNAPGIYPIPGSVMVWNGRTGGGYGHTAIVVSSDPDADTFTVFEQNSPLNAPPIVKTYTSWTNVTGWLIPKIADTDIGEPTLPEENPHKNCIPIDEHITVVSERDSKDRKLEDCRDAKAKMEADKDKLIEQSQKSLSLANEQLAGNIKSMGSGIESMATIASNLMEYQEKGRVLLEGKIEVLEANLLPYPKKILELEQEVSEKDKKLNQRIKSFGWWEFIKTKVGA